MSGEYSIAEPGGGLRVVSYHADKDGFHAVVHTSGKNEHHGFPQGHLASATEEQQLLQEYPVSYAAQQEETTYWPTTTTTWLTVFPLMYTYEQLMLVD